MRSSIESTNVENSGSKRIYFGRILKDAVPFIGFILILVFFPVGQQRRLYFFRKLKNIN